MNNSVEVPSRESPVPCVPPSMRASPSFRSRPPPPARVPLAAALLASAVLGACRPPALRPAPGSNVILVCVDSLRPDHLGCYGYSRNTSPHLDRIAGAGLRFEEAVANATWTLPSITTLFTSLYPSTHGMHSYSMDLQRTRPLPAGVLTLAGFLAGRGYETAAFSDGGWVSRDFGLDRGFERWEEGTLGIKVLVDRSLAAASGGSGRPFFHYLHAHTVHWPYRPPPAYRSAFGIEDRDYLGRDYPWLELQKRADRGEIPPAEMAQIVRQYDAGIAYADAQIGRLVEGLRERGIADKTLLVVFADHGEQFLEHGQVYHGQLNDEIGPNRKTCYEETVRVPLIMAGPGVAEGAVAGGQVSLIDLFPTLVSYLGFELPPGVGQGMSFLSGEGRPWALIEDNLNWLAALRSPEWKLIVDRREGRAELYDLKSDPGEKADLSASRADEVKGIRAVYEEKERENRARGKRLVPASGPSVVSPGVRDHLKALGYVQ